jgi:predicted amidophosphoribosyltransferase
LHLVAIPIWLPLLIFAAPAGLWLRGVLRRRRGAHECPSCGYDLRATPDRCPECGTPAAAAP